MTLLCYTFERRAQDTSAALFDGRMLLCEKFGVTRGRGVGSQVVASLEGGFVCSGVLSGREEVGQAEDETGETPLSAAANHAGLRDAMVALAKGEVELDDLISI